MSKTAKTSRPLTHLTLAEALFTQGFGTRRDCAGLAASGRAQVAGRDTSPDGDEPIALDGLVLRVDGVDWPYRASALVLLHKPAGYECSMKPSAWPSVMTLLPPPLRVRGLQPVGRLDADTTGALLLTDDGTLLHKLTSPKHHVPKVYEARTARPLTAAQVEQLLTGVVLNDDPRPVRANAASIADQGDGHVLRLTLTEGKYHQVRRMVAAVGNPVEALQRVSIGALVLPAELAPGRWMWTTPQAVFG